MLTNTTKWFENGTDTGKDGTQPGPFLSFHQHTQRLSVKALRKMRYFVGRKYIRLLSFVIAQCTFVFPCSAIPILRNFLDKKTTEE
jgi:hypothetical protein